MQPWKVRWTHILRMKNGNWVIADRIIGLYAMGNSTREISDWMEENLGNRVSADTISAITDRVLPEIKAWKSRMLDSVYPIVWMDAIHYKVTDERGFAVCSVP